MQLRLALETQTMATLSPTHYLQYFPQTAFIIHEEKSCIVQVSTVANSSRQLLQRLGVEGRVIASFHNIGGNFVRNGYEFLYSRRDFVGNISDSIPAVQMVAESKTEENEQQIHDGCQ
jgi:hypothetical protein